GGVLGAGFAGCIGHGRWACALAGDLFLFFAFLMALDLHLVNHVTRRIGRHRSLPGHHLVEFLSVGKIFREFLRTHAEGAEGLQTRVESLVVDLFGMQLQLDPLVDTHRRQVLYVARTRTEGQSIQGMQSAALLVGSRGLILFLFFLSRQKWRDHRRKTEAQAQENCGPRAQGSDAKRSSGSTHENSQPGKATSSPIIKPKGRKMLLAK